ncbi:uncharacterized protein LOC121394320 [Xenopus laevis]|uniref:Uncharacterized protein LOC121394320 n=1 Tax=Xenopus laevis TaxID=8355 RepID=A0A8J1KXK6_XENLA|nr:uncharacterized protein LOC121394320 [Xenopus laevis]
MGSGCSRDSSSVLIVRSQQPRPPSKREPSVGNRVQEETVVSQIKTEDEPTKEGKESERGRLIPRVIDEDLQMLDELLEDSQDCLSGTAPKFKAQTPLKSRCHLTSPQLGPQIYGEKPLNPDTSWTIQAQVQPSASLLHNIHYRQLDTRSKTVLKTRNTQDAENNNLPYQFQCAQEAEEEKPTLKYNKSEEVLMDIIARQYSQ